MIWSTSLAWTVEFTPRAQRDFKKLDSPVRQRIRDFLRERVATLNDPKQLGEPLAGPLAQLWRYRVGDYRIICRIEYERIVILVVGIGHRRDIYR
jgi:mRNA interferase RelE/StbE